MRLHSTLVRIAKIALRYLPISATKVPSECMFSTVGAKSCRAACVSSRQFVIRLTFIVLEVKDTYRCFLVACNVLVLSYRRFGI